MNPIIYDIIFYILALMVVVSAAFVSISKNIVRSAFALVYTFIGVAGLFILLSADFIAATQVLVYVGGTLVLILFAVMLSSRISDIKISNLSVGFIPGFFVTACFSAVLIYIAVSGQWQVSDTKDTLQFSPTTQAIGDALLSKWLLAFEVISILILAGLIGAVVIARQTGHLKEGRK